jgi:hypothetical protein
MTQQPNGWSGHRLEPRGSGFATCLLWLSGLREDGMVSGFMPVIWPVSVMA